MENNQYIVTFYKFFTIDDNKLKRLQKDLFKICSKHNILGTIYIANEGINTTLVGKENDLTQTLFFIEEILTPLWQQAQNNDSRFIIDNNKKTFCPEAAFSKLKVKIKQEIVKLEVDVDNIQQKNQGSHVSPQQWNELIQDQDTKVIDLRNYYECEIGTFTNAINPDLDVFTDFKDYVKNIPKQQKIAMCCTGGIRCEKAAAYMKDLGFEQVYQLDGGIINYLLYQPQENLWQGRCFVFDDRVALDKNMHIDNSDLQEHISKKPRTTKYELQTEQTEK